MRLALAAVLLASAPVPPESRQLVLAVSKGWDSPRVAVSLYDRSGSTQPWRLHGETLDASIGRNGLAWGRGFHASDLEGPTKVEGDGRAPAGVFALRFATGYAGSAPPGTRLAYRAASDDLRCVDDPSSAFYNRLVDQGIVAADWRSAERMRRPDNLYRLTVWVGHNDDPVKPGLGSCIFLHVRSSVESRTEGCTAFDATALEAILEWLDPALRPVLVQLPLAALQRHGRAWDLPATD